MHGWGVSADFVRILDERSGELCEREFERESAIVTGPFVALDQTADLGPPFGREVPNGEVEGFRFRVGASSLTFAHHEVLQSADIETEGFGASLTRDFAGCAEHRVEQGMVESEQRVHRMVASLRWASFDCTLLPGAARESGLLIQGGINEAGHERVLFPN